MVATPQLNAPQGGAIVVSRQAAHAINVPQAEPVAVYNVPAFQMNATYAEARTVYRRIAAQIDVQTGGVVAVVSGRVANPRIRAWTFTLDGHDFYVLRLGDKETLVYDVASERWTEWTSDISPFWRANTGFTWIGGQGLGRTYGSNVMVGDDLYGLLWFLDPTQGFDQHPDYTNPQQQIPFPRVVTGQVLAGNRQYLPCYALFVDGDNYGLIATDFTPSVTLETSDDQGRTFTAHDTLGVVPDPAQDDAYAWYSLGQISSPGRIFRVTDNGLFARIDTMSTPD